MIQVASELLSTLSEGQENVAVARRVPVAILVVVAVALLNIAAVVTTLTQGSP